MPSTPSLISRLRSDYPSVTFIKGDDFYWSPDGRSIHYAIGQPHLLLHELGHALLGHADYSTDLDLIKMERDAWQEAKQLAEQYEVAVTEEIVQQHLDTYRDWLHARSTCPQCSATGHQVKRQRYHCVACGEEWRVNEARLCGLKRYSLPKTTKIPR